MESVDRYLSLRRTVGFKLDTVEYRLRSFARFAAAKGDQVIRAASAVDWASLGPSPLARRNRLHTIVRFVRHIRAEEPAHELPDFDHFGRGYTRRPPYIFSRNEVRSLLRASDELEPVGGLRPATFRTLIGLLAATGIRLGEARSLLLDDVLRKESALFVRRGKCGKSRVIPIHASTLRALEEYIVERERWVPRGTHVFVTPKGTLLPKPTINWTFARLRRCLPADRDRNSRLPRLHDLRHTFAVRALEACPREGRDHIGRHMQAIAQYLGHSSITFTYWYFESTPMLMRDMAEAARSVLEGTRK